jgi:anti-anti-sigma factor
MLGRSSTDDTVTVDVTRYRGVPVLTVSGELDSTTVQPVRAGLFDQLDRGHRGLVVDLSGVTFMGSTGLQVLVDAIAHARRSGKVLAVTARHRAVLLPMRLTDLDRAVAVRATVHEAATAVLSS